MRPLGDRDGKREPCVTWYPEQRVFVSDRDDGRRYICGEARSHTGHRCVRPRRTLRDVAPNDPVNDTGPRQAARITRSYVGLRRDCGDAPPLRLLGRQLHGRRRRRCIRCPRPLRCRDPSIIIITILGPVRRWLHPPPLTGVTPGPSVRPVNPALPPNEQAYACPRGSPRLDYHPATGHGVASAYFLTYKHPRRVCSGRRSG